MPTRGNAKPLLILLDILVTIALAIVVGYGVGKLFVWLWAPTPTPDNASPPPEAFLFVAGAVVGFLAAIVARVALAVWVGRRAQRRLAA